MAATYPPVPAPITITSYSLAIETASHCRLERRRRSSCRISADNRLSDSRLEFSSAAICGHLRLSVVICGLSAAICGHLRLICGYLRLIFALSAAYRRAVCGYLRLSAARSRLRLAKGTKDCCAGGRSLNCSSAVGAMALILDLSSVCS